MMSPRGREARPGRTAVRTPARRWRIAAASMQGSNHEKMGLPCQDACVHRSLPGGIFVAAVADGAGSARHSDTGAAVAAKKAVDTIAAQAALARLPEDDEAWRSLLVDAFTVARGAVEREAAELGASPRDLATTLILVVGTRRLTAVAQVGDGAAIMCDDAGEIGALTVPHNGEYLNETEFLVAPQALESIQWAVRRGEPAHVAVLSDGLEMLALKMPGGVPHQPFFDPLFRFMADVGGEQEANRQLQEFLGSTRIRERTDDDITLLLASLRG